MVQNAANETPKAAVISGQLQKKLARQQPKKPERGVIFIKNLPQGFFENELTNYFAQFGRVTRVRVARSRHTGGCRGFAYVEMEYPEVAKAATETLNNKLMFNKIVKASYIAPEEQKCNLFKTSVRQVKNKAGKDIFVSGKILAISRRVREANNWSVAAYQKRTEKTLKKVKALEAKCAGFGFDVNSVVVAPTIVTPAPEPEPVLKPASKSIKKKTQLTTKAQAEIKQKAKPQALIIEQKAKVGQAQAPKAKQKAKAQGHPKTKPTAIAQSQELKTKKKTGAQQKTKAQDSEPKTKRKAQTEDQELMAKKKVKIEAPKIVKKATKAAEPKTKHKVKASK